MELFYLPSFPMEQGCGEEQSMEDVRKALRTLSSPLPPMGSSTCWDWEPLAPPQIPSRHLQPSLPYELVGQVLHKMIDLIPVMQDASWSRDTMITGHISLSFPSHLFCHTLLSETFASVLLNTHCPCSSFKERSNCNWHLLLSFKKQEQFPLHASVWGCPWQ